MISRVRQMASTVRRVWRELDYAQRRLFELQTQLPDERLGGRALAEVRALESLWALPAREPVWGR
jgi:hypothetical protein